MYNQVIVSTESDSTALQVNKREREREDYNVRTAVS